MAVKSVLEMPAADFDRDIAAQRLTVSQLERWVQDAAAAVTKAGGEYRQAAATTVTGGEGDPAAAQRAVTDACILRDGYVEALTQANARLDALVRDQQQQAGERTARERQQRLEELSAAHAALTQQLLANIAAISHDLDRYHELGQEIRGMGGYGLPDAGQLEVATFCGKLIQYETRGIILHIVPTRRP